MNKESCCFYEKKHTPLGDYYVCHHSKTVLFSVEKGQTLEDTCNAVYNFLSVVQEKRLALQDSLHKLAQRQDSGEKLSDEEQETYDKLQELCDIFTDFQQEGIIHIDPNGGISQKKDAVPYGKSSGSKEAIYKTLYRLLMISDWLKEKFGIEE